MNKEEFEQELSRHTANMDQVGEEIKKAAPIVKEHFDKLIDKGYERREALIFTLEFQTKLIHYGMYKKPKYKSK